MRVLSDVRDSQRYGRELSSSDFPQTFSVCFTAKQLLFKTCEFCQRENDESQDLNLQLASLTRPWPKPYSLGTGRGDAVLQGRSRLQHPASAAAPGPTR